MALILFDSSHNEYLRIAKPGTLFFGPNPSRFDWTDMAFLLLENGFELAILDGGLISAKPLKNADIFVIGQPESHFYHSKPGINRDDRRGLKWGYLQESEITDIVEFVENGGGLFITQEKMGEQRRGNNLNCLSSKFGITFKDDHVESEHHYKHDAGWLFLENLVQHPVFQGVEKLIYFNGCSLLVQGPGKALAYSDPGAEPPNVPLIAVSHYGKGKVVAIGDATMFSEWGLGENNEYGQNHHRFLFNIFSWLTPSCYFEKDGKVVESSVRCTTSDLAIPLILSRLSRFFKKSETDVRAVQYEIKELSAGSSQNSVAHQTIESRISGLATQIDKISRKVGAAPSPAILAFLTTVVEFMIVVGGFMLGYLLTGGFRGATGTPIIIILALSIIVIFLLKLVEFFLLGKK